MIELNDEQRRELTGPEPVALDPQTQQVYVLVRKEIYERLKELAYDDSPWTGRGGGPASGGAAGKRRGG